MYILTQANQMLIGMKMEDTVELAQMITEEKVPEEVIIEEKVSAVEQDIEA